MCNNCLTSLICTLFCPKWLIFSSPNLSHWVSSFNVELKLGNHFWLICILYWFHLVAWQEIWVLYSKYFVNPTPSATSLHLNCTIVKDLQLIYLPFIPSHFSSLWLCFLINHSLVGASSSLYIKFSINSLPRSSWCVATISPTLSFQVYCWSLYTLRTTPTGLLLNQTSVFSSGCSPTFTWFSHPPLSAETLNVLLPHMLPSAWSFFSTQLDMTSWTLKPQSTLFLHFSWDLSMFSLSHVYTDFISLLYA